MIRRLLNALWGPRCHECGSRVRARSTQEVWAHDRYNDHDYEPETR